MKLQKRAPSVPSLVIAISALILGALFGIGFESLTIAYRGAAYQSGASLTMGIATAVIALIVVALVVLKSSADRRFQIESDLLDAFLEHIPDNVFFKDRNSRFVRISRGMANYFGLTHPVQAVGKTDSDIFSSEHADQAFEDEQEIIRTGQAKIGIEEKETWPDGRESWVLTTKVPLKDSRSRIIGTMGIAHNITDRKRAEDRVRHMALHDALTGLPNRTLLEDRLAQAIALAGRSKKSVAVLMLDLDRFKNVNDSFGHYVGDRLLEAVSRRIQGCLRESDIVARLGGDEFVIGIPIVSAESDVEIVAQKVLAALAEPIQIEGRQLQIGASIGIAEYPGDGLTPAVLIQFADAAMYEAKKKGRGVFQFFTPRLTEATQRRQKLDTDLRQAIARSEFELHYQPFISTNSGLITGVEALLRWQHPDEGLIPPNEFIPQLEDLGLMVEVGDWVLRTACLQNAAWKKEGLLPIRMAVNLSAQQFYRGNIVETVAKTLQETGLEARWLELELTESLTLDGSENTINIMQSLKRIGVSLSLDDFGIGWSSLSYLRKFPLDRIKIDRSFIRDIATEPAAEAVVRSILSLGSNLGLQCIAEGVETSQQQDHLHKHLCSEMQGFLYSRAVPARECATLLQSGIPGYIGAVAEPRSPFSTKGKLPRAVRLG